MIDWMIVNIVKLQNVRRDKEESLQFTITMLE